MNALNSIILEGNLVRDAEVKKTNIGTSVADMTIAINHSYKNADGISIDEVSYFDVKAWSCLADCCEKYATKGCGIRVVGRLKQERWKSDGRTYSKVVVLAEHIEFKPVVDNKKSK